MSTENKVIYSMVGVSKMFRNLLNCEAQVNNLRYKIMSTENKVIYSMVGVNKM